MAASSAHPALRDRPAHRARGSSVDLYWLPLGAGGHSVRFNGVVYEVIAARLGRRARCDLYHSALEVRYGHERYVIEMAPAWNERAGNRGVVGEGAVASPPLGRLRAFRYEIRRWRDGRIPDIAEAVDSPQRLSEDPAVARRVLELAPMVPRFVWGRDEAQTGDMWNSNSITAWLLVRSGIDIRLAHVPAGGRAPGWDAGLALARASPSAVYARRGRRRRAARAGCRHRVDARHARSGVRRVGPHARTLAPGPPADRRCRPLTGRGVLRACVAFSWAWRLPLMVNDDTVGRGDGWPTHIPGLLGPLLAALIVLARTEGPLGVRRWLAAMVRVPHQRRLQLAHRLGALRATFVLALL